MRIDVELFAAMLRREASKYSNELRNLCLPVLAHALTERLDRCFDDLVLLPDNFDSSIVSLGKDGAVLYLEKQLFRVCSPKQVFDIDDLKKEPQKLLDKLDELADSMMKELNAIRLVYKDAMPKLVHGVSRPSMFVKTEAYNVELFAWFYATLDVAIPIQDRANRKHLKAKRSKR